MANLVKTKEDLAPVVTNIRKMMNDIDKAFRTKGGKKRDYTYKMSIDTNKAEANLDRVKSLLTDIQGLSKGINIVIDTGKALDSNKLKDKVKALRDKKLAEERNADIRTSAAESVKSMMSAQSSITKVIGKINAALISLERDREINIKTDVAKQRLETILSLMTQIKGASKMTLGMGMGSPGQGGQNTIPNYIRPPFAYSPIKDYILPQKVSDKLQEKLVTNGALGQQKAGFARADELAKVNQQRALTAIRGDEWDRQRTIRANDNKNRQLETESARLAREKTQINKQNAANIINRVQQQQRSGTLFESNKKRAAINRLQYAKVPSFQSMPIAQMINAYAAYGVMRSEIVKAVEYSNIMTSAQSILRVADSDLSTFENRFSKMALYVRQIGVETKFTAVEVAGAVKYLSMAGMGIETINESIRPITNLAIIGDNDVSQIADLATNIMAGYDIKSSSMSSVADILASTISRSNVNVIEMAESYKMAAGYMRLAGVDFTESSAAIGILGNMGIKGTMAGTALRAMATRFAKPTKESQGALDRMGVDFTHYVDVYGKQVERLRPLANIFEDLNKKGATMGDMQTIFGKIGGNAAMMFVRNYEQLRTLTTQNQGSHNIATELAKVKQDNAKGLWAQMTSQFTESFMQGYELIEPIIKSTMRDFLNKFKTREFALGIASIGQAILNVVSILGRLGIWFSSNMSWLGPVVFTGFVAVKLFKLAGALTNVGVALGFLGKQSAVSGGLQTISSLVGLGGGSGGGKLSFGSKRQIVKALGAAGISGKGAMSKAILSSGALGITSKLGLFATQIATGNGILSAGASIGALGAGAIGAAAGVATLVGALGWVAYKTWKIKEAKDAVLEEITANEKYRYPSIDALNKSLSETYKKALEAKKAVGELTGGKTIEEASGQTIGVFTGNWWSALLGGFTSPTANYTPYSYGDARQDDTINAITTIARRDSQARINSAYAELGKARTDVQIGAFMANIESKFGQNEKNLETSFYTVGRDGNIKYNKGVGDMKDTDAYKLPHYVNYMNEKTVPEIVRLAEEYRSILSSPLAAESYLSGSGFNLGLLTESGFVKNKDGNWVQTPLDAKATDQQRIDALAAYQNVHNKVTTFTGSLRDTWGGSPEIAQNIMRKAGFLPSLFSNEPDLADPEPFNANGITTTGPDDGLAGGNYSNTGKLSSASPKQVIVNITNLLSVETIKLLQSEDGQYPEIKNLKEQMAQALIDVVHDFDVSWNG